MTKTRKKYSKEFKQKAVELSNVRGNTQQVARELGISAELLYTRRKEMRHSPDLAFSGNVILKTSNKSKEFWDHWEQFIESAEGRDTKGVIGHTMP